MSRPRPMGEAGVSGQRGGGGSPGPHPGGRLGGLVGGLGVSRLTPWGVSRPTPGEGEVAVSGWRVSRPKSGGPGLGVSRPRPGGSRPRPGGSRPRGCIPACTEADPPSTSRRLLPRAVRILLQCILVLN